MSNVLDKTQVDLKAGETLQFGPLSVNDAAKSIELRAEGLGKFLIRLEVKNRWGRFLWGGSVGSDDLGHARIGAGRAKYKINWITQKLETVVKYYRNQKAFITFQALTDFNGVLQAVNSITVGTPASTEGFGSSLTVSVDAGVGSNRLMLAGIWHNSQAINAFTYNANALTAISGAIGTSGASNALLYRYIAPATGAHDLALTLSGATDAGIGGIPLDGVDQTTPAENGTGASGSGSPVTVNVTSATGNLVVDVFRLSHTGGGSTTTVGADQTARIDRENYSGAASWGMSTEAGAGTVTMSWTGTNAGGWVQAAASIKAAVTGVTVAPTEASAVASTVNPTIVMSSMTVAPAAATAVGATAGPQIGVSSQGPLIGSVSMDEGFGSAMSITVDAGTAPNRVVYGILTRNARNISGTPTYKGVNGTLVGEIEGTGTRISVYRWNDPATGAGTMSFATAGSTDWKLYGVPLSGIDLTNPDDTPETTTGTVSPQSEDVASQSGDIVIAAGFVAFSGGGASITLAGSTTSLDVDTAVAAGSRGSWLHTEDGAASVTMGASGSQWGNWAHFALNINAAPVALGVSPNPAEAFGSVVNPTVVQSSMTVAPAAANAIGATVDPTVDVIGGQVITPVPAEAFGSTVNPTVVGGGVSVTPAAASAVGSTPNPGVQLGSLNIIPTTIDCVAATTFEFFLGGAVTLTWDDPPEPHDGFKVYYSPVDGPPYNGTGAIRDDLEVVADSPIDVGNVNTITLKNLKSNQNWYFAVTAYSAAGESGYSNELVVFVTTGLFLAPNATSAISAAVDPTIQLGSLTIAPAPVEGIAAAVGAAVVITGVPGGVSVVPTPANTVGGTLTPSVAQSSMIVGNLLATAIGAGVNPTVVVGGGITVVPDPVEAFGTVVDPSVIMGSIVILVDNIPEIANAIGSTENPIFVYGSVIVTPAPADAIAAVEGPDFIGFSSVVFTPAPAEAFASTVNPNSIGGLPAPVAANFDSSGLDIDRYGFRF